MKRLKHLCGRSLYGIARHLPESYASINIGQKKLRAFCAKMILAKCGEGINVEKGAIFASNVELGNHSGIGINARISGRCIIGDNVMMGPECMIYTTNHAIDRTDIPMNMQGNEAERPVVIEDDVWIGARVTILPGCHIHKGSVIAAGAVVTEDVASFAVVGGGAGKSFEKKKMMIQFV